MAKSHSALERLFPLTGKPGLMLAEYVRLGARGSDIAGAGRRAGLSYATANRANAVLVDSGLIIPNQRGGYEFNLDAPHSRVALDAVRAATGYQYRDESDLWSDDYRWDGGVASLSVTDTVLQRRMPEPLIRRGHAAAGTAVVVPGPTALETRTFAMDIERAVGSSLSLLVDTLQEPYGLWHVERDRNLIHKTMHLGAGVYAAIQALTTKDGEREETTGVPAVRWVHAVYALAAEATYTRELITEFAHLADLTKLRDKVAARLTELGRRFDMARSDDVLTGSSRMRILEDYQAEITHAEEQRDLIDQVLREGHGRGELGFSAARLLFGTLEHYHRIIAPLAREGFEHPCVKQWTQAYEDAAAQGMQEAVDFDEFPVPTGDDLPRHIRLNLDDIDAALNGNPGHRIAPFLRTPSAPVAAL